VALTPLEFASPEFSSRRVLSRHPAARITTLAFPCISRRECEGVGEQQIDRTGEAVLTLRGAPFGVALSAADAPVQPIPFSHKVHAGAMKLTCKTCHPNPDPGETMTIAKPATCMQCHSAIKTESPAIQRLAAAAKEDKPLPWVRVYAIPSFVIFSHR
jgi:hypothetical protein